jgi:hypothetical protein
MAFNEFEFKYSQKDPVIWIKENEEFIKESFNDVSYLFSAKLNKVIFKIIDEIFLVNKDYIKQVKEHRSLGVMSYIQYLAKRIIYKSNPATNLYHILNLKEVCPFCKYDHFEIKYLENGKKTVQCVFCGRRIYKTACKKCGEKTLIIPRLKKNINRTEITDFCRKCLKKFIKCTSCSIMKDKKEFIINGISSKEIKICDQCSKRQIHIFNYSENAGKIFILDKKERKTKNKVYYGVELEVGANDHLHSYEIKKINSYLNSNFFFYKSDGSIIGDTTFEIVTAPFTWNFFNKNGSIFSDLFSDLKIAGFTSGGENDCGMHVHFSRNALKTIKSFVVIYKILSVQDFVYKMSNRSDINKLHWAKILNVDCLHRYKSILSKNFKSIIGTKYVALNCLHPKTFELRIFSGTLDFNEFVENMYFTNFLIQFSNKYSKAYRKPLEITHDFIKFIKKDNKYSFLRKKMAKLKH